MSAHKPFQAFGSSSELPRSTDENLPEATPLDIDQMLSGLPGAAPQQAAAAGGADADSLQADFDRMFSSTSHDSAADFEFRPAAPKPEVAAPQGPLSTGKLGRYATDDVAQRPAGAPRRAKPLSSPEIAPVAPPKPANLFGEEDAADILNIPVEAPPASRPSRLSPTAPSPRPATPIVRESFGRTPSPDREPAPVYEGALGQRVLDELEKYSISSVSQLRIAVHGGTVTIMGDVPTDYEKKLVMHFSRKVDGVDEVVDMMRISGGPGLSSGPDVPGAKPAAARKPKPKVLSTGTSLNLPFRAKHIGIAAGLLVSIWAGYSFATRDGGGDLSVHPVTGTVLYDGTAAEGATVTLHPLDRSLQVRPKGFVKADGTFQVTTYLPADGAPSGEYKVTVEWKKPVPLGGDEFTPGPNVLPDVLSKPESTTYNIKVGWGNNEIPAIKVTR